MDAEQLAARTIAAGWANEIERAISRAKRSAEDRQFRRMWYKAERRRHNPFRMNKGARMMDAEVRK